ncbi:hypothetical protein SAMN00808754_3251 [Thermanaeromonas toyohensis ToBE]|uniref:Uncharacterized protein n=1 Tax=Thermanaeromonas toyohensis ToBE TaxID=698762 RepID=A0A1W1W353_9FIRM|nr:hypothetical protein [Thermanaeromonas toyohensis]SMC00062.1 hypothetical protein SAMN00808754_3251 [Thermanaeromonas toyohensis ToBE]
MQDNPRKIDEQRWEAERLGEELEQKRQEFVRSILRRSEGISAEREKFIHDLKTGSPKTPKPNT